MTQQRNGKIKRKIANASKREMKIKELAYKKQLIVEYKKLKKTVQVGRRYYSSTWTWQNL